MNDAGEYAGIASSGHVASAVPEPVQRGLPARVSSQPGAPAGNQCCGAGLNTGEWGILHSTNGWSKLEVTRLPIGHSCAVTLLQLLRAYTALFNDGRMVEPTLIAATRAAAGADWQPAPVTAPKSVLRPETAAWLRTTLRKDLGDGLSAIGQPAIVQKTLTSDSGYDSARVLTAFIGSLNLAGTPHLVAVWLDEPVRDSDPNPALQVFRRVAQMNEGRSGHGNTMMK